MERYKAILKKYIPEAAVPAIMDLLTNANVQLNITKTRTSKLGDYRPPHKYQYHKISVNHDLNKYQFLLTLVHEFAHLRTFEQHKNTVKPHGKEWKSNFKQLMDPFMKKLIFPEPLLNTIRSYMRNPSSSTSNTDLLKAKRNYDKKKPSLTLEDIPFQSQFSIHNGIVFQKLEKLRKRYKCLRLDNKRIYLVNAMAEVIPVEK